MPSGRATSARELVVIIVIIVVIVVVVTTAATARATLRVCDGGAGRWGEDGPGRAEGEQEESDGEGEDAAHLR